MANNELKIDPSDPMYIHPSDHPGMVLVSPVFEGRNFGEWRRSMRIALSVKNKVGFITRSILKPPETLPMHRAWQRCNDMVIPWLINGLSPDFRRIVIYTEDASEIWEELESRFGKPGGAQIYYVQKELSALEQGYAGRGRGKSSGNGAQFAGTVGEVGSSEFTPEQIKQLVSLMQSVRSPNQSKEPTVDDFAGFSGAFYEEPDEAW